MPKKSKPSKKFGSYKTETRIGNGGFVYRPGKKTFHMGG